MQDSDTPAPSRRIQIRSAVLNTSIGQWMRSIDLVMEHHTDSGDDPEEEAETVTRHALLMMMTRYFDEDAVCVLADTPSHALPRELEESSAHDIRAFIDGESK